MAEAGALAAAFFEIGASPGLGAAVLVPFPGDVAEGVPDLIGAGSANVVRLALDAIMVD